MDVIFMIVDDVGGWMMMMMMDALARRLARVAGFADGAGRLYYIYSISVFFFFVRPRGDYGIVLFFCVFYVYYLYLEYVQKTKEPMPKCILKK